MMFLGFVPTARRLGKGFLEEDSESTTKLQKQVNSLEIISLLPTNNKILQHKPFSGNTLGFLLSFLWPLQGLLARAQGFYKNFNQATLTQTPWEVSTHG